eukprot:TRINITY_DN16948_c0_g1_i1.p1 TRINITY_DN16948_c0_g1~~TRINITY_DN16948_c0_g1_i1.p1  ORF type:complete len:367 (-),score=84.45 TRINITY_DN16948_c0_g1_i1:46-1146(-)
MAARRESSLSDALLSPVHADRIELPLSFSDDSSQSEEVAVDLRVSSAALLDAQESLRGSFDYGAVESPRRSPKELWNWPNHTPYVIRTLVALNVVMFIVEMSLGGWQFAPLAQNPTVGPFPHILKISGAKDTYRVQEYHEYWRLFVPMFLHAGLIHLFLNMMALRNVGEGLEQEHGHWKIVSIYLLSGLTSSMTSAVFLPRQIGVGASGAIYGLVGACAVDLVYSWKYTENRKQLLCSLIFSLVIGLGLGLLPLMDNFAHLGGLLGGFLISVIILGHARIEQSESSRVQRIKLIVRVICGGLLAGFVVFLVIVLFSGMDGNDLCPWCKYASCVNTPWWSCEPVRCLQTLPDNTVREIDWKYCDDLI